MLPPFPSSSILSYGAVELPACSSPVISSFPTSNAPRGASLPTSTAGRFSVLNCVSDAAPPTPELGPGLSPSSQLAEALEPYLNAACVLLASPPFCL